MVLVSKTVVFGIVGGVALMCGLVATIWYANATFDEALQESVSGAGALHFNEKTASLPSETRNGNNGATLTVAKNINVQNLKEVRFTLSWTDDEPYLSGADELTMLVLVPNGANVEYISGPEISDASGQIKIIVKVNDAPKAGGEPTDNGAGEWRVQVMVDSSQLLPELSQITTDFGNDWTLDTEYVYFEQVN